MSFSTIKKAATFSLILVAFTMFVGCGGDEGQIKSVTKKFVGSMLKGDLDKMKDCMSKDGQKGMDAMMASAESKKAMGDMFKELGKKATAPAYGKVEVDGEKATIEVTITEKGKDKKDSDTKKLPLVKEDGKWKIVSLN